MGILLIVLAILAFLAGFAVLAVAQSAIHEIEGFVLFLISAVFVSGAAVVEAVKVKTDAVGAQLNTAIGHMDRQEKFLQAISVNFVHLLGRLPGSPDHASPSTPAGGSESPVLESPPFDSPSGKP
jgi:hypothetical protein